MAKDIPPTISNQSIPFCQRGIQSLKTYKWKNAGKTNANIAQTVLPTREMNTPNVGTNTATTAIISTRTPLMKSSTNLRSVVLEAKVL